VENKKDEARSSDSIRRFRDVASFERTFFPKAWKDTSTKPESLDFAREIARRSVRGLATTDPVVREESKK
jgi:hypothetical protein